MNPEDYENQIALLKKALEFYANSTNYLNDKFIHGKGNISLIDIDEHGSQARFALKTIETVQKENEKMKADYNQIIGDTISAIENTPINLGDMITTMKNIEKDGDN